MSSKVRAVEAGTSSMGMSANRMLKFALSLLLAGLILSFAFSSTLYNEAITDAFFACALASVTILHLRVRWNWPDALGICVLALGLGAIDRWGFHYTPAAPAWVSFVGLSSFLILGTRAIWANSQEERRLLICAWMPAALFVLLEYSASTMLA